MLELWKPGPLRKSRVVAAVVFAALAVLVSVGPAAADHDTGVTTTTYPESQGIIPEPDTGVAPSDAGDRGGALQSVLFVAILGGIGVIGFFAVRESRRVRAERGF